ncbi:MAG: DMT family transporter [Methylococcaceae bacterium]|nr:DMT family transporter [Methylococcaceae bacterium]
MKSPHICGLLDMIGACLLFSMMNASVYAITDLDNTIPSSVISFVRILCNLLILLVPTLINRNPGSLLGDRRPSLWLRGLFGAIALMLSFAGISRIGPGESAFLTASSGVFVALLGPVVLKQRNSWLGWLAIIGSLAGVSLLFAPGDGRVDLLGRAMALASGLLSALAFLMVARAGRSNSPASVIFYFCLAALIVHLLYFALYGYTVPDQAEIWGLLLLTGALGSGAQYFMTRAYQTAPAASVSAVGYLTPVFSLSWGVLLFSQIPSQLALLGSLLILLFGVLLPFLR